MKIFRSKGYACKKQFSNDNLPSRPYSSTTSLGESLWQNGPPYLPILIYYTKQSPQVRIFAGFHARVWNGRLYTVYRSASWWSASCIYRMWIEAGQQHLVSLIGVLFQCLRFSFPFWQTWWQQQEAKTRRQQQQLYPLPSASCPIYFFWIRLACSGRGLLLHFASSVLSHGNFQYFWVQSTLKYASTILLYMTAWAITS